MPNTKSAERRVRSSARKQIRNQSIKSRLKTLERGFKDAMAAGNKEVAAQAFRNAVSALDKAAKKGIIHKSKADRKKSRLSLKLASS